MANNKRVALSMLVLSTVFILSACANKEELFSIEEPPIRTATSESNSLIQNHTLPCFPPLNRLVEWDVIPEINSEGHEIPFEYSISEIASSFSENLSGMSVEKYSLLLDKTNFLPLEDGILFFTNKSYAGPSKIFLDTKDGETKEILTASTPILSMRLLADKSGLLIEFSRWISSQYGLIEWYILDFENMELELYDSGRKMLEITYEHSFISEVAYHDQVFFDVIPISSSTGELLPSIFYSRSKESTLIQLDSELILFGDASFVNEKIFYQRRATPNIVFINNLGWNEEQILYKSEQEIYSVLPLSDSSLVTFEEDGNSYYIGGNKKKVLLPYTINLGDDSLKLGVVENGIFLIDEKDYMLRFINWEGSMVPCIRAYEGIKLLSVEQNWVFFSYEDHKISTQVFVAKIKLDGTGFVLLT